MVLSSSLLFLFFYPFLEEVSKLLAARLSTIKNRYFCDEATDPMIYIITAALGFAAVENLRVYFLTIFEHASQISWAGVMDLNLPRDILTQLMFTAFIRFLATVLLHATASAIVGYFWALGRLGPKKNLVSFFTIPFGLILATLLHSFYNYFIMNIDKGYFYLVGVIVLLFVSSAVVGRNFRQLSSLSKVAEDKAKN